MRYAFLVFFCVFPFKVTAGGWEDSGNPLFSRQCNYDEECEALITDSKCSNYKCNCPSGKLLNSDGSKCLRKVKGYGDSCEDNIQCSMSLSNGGLCISGKCKCKEGFHFQQDKCWKNADLNEYCTSNRDCFSAYEYVGLECEDKKCKCRKNYYQRLNSGCRRKRLIGESCNLDSDCPIYTTCHNMICSNRNTTSEFSNSTDYEEYDFDENEQIQNGELGQTCDIYSLGYPYNNLRYRECKGIKNTVCLERLCTCEPAIYVASADNKRCLPSTPGKVKDIRQSFCKEDAQCAVFGGNSICKNGKCACKGGSYFEVKHQFCWPYNQVGDECEVTEDCNPSRSHAECKNETCTCMEGYHQKGTYCEPVALKVGDFCEDDHECLFQHSFCDESNSCTCKENYYTQNGKCVGGVNSICETDADCCHLRNTNCNNTEPNLWQCLCRKGYTSSPDWKYCLPGVKYGGKCQESFQCKGDLGKFGECIEGVCKCRSKAHYSHRKCYISKFVKESCSKVSECHPGNDTNSVICLNGLCSCNYGYQLGRLGICVKTNSASHMTPYFLVLLSALFFLR